MRVDSSTELYGIFGHPVKHSFSPAMHNAAFNKLDINSVYLAFDIFPDNLELAVNSIKQLNIKGINVTIPHKQEIIKYLDEISEEAKYTGAVNTVKNTNGYLYGHNTDVGGFLKALEVDLDLIGFTDKSAVLIGAGGAARAVLSALCMKNIKSINIFNRSVDKASSLSEYFKRQFSNVNIEHYKLSDNGKLNESLSKSDLIINSTSGGMHGHESLDLSLQNLKHNSYVYDLVYNPRETDLVKHARTLGHKASAGLSMLLYQGAESFEVWTGLQAPIMEMKNAIESD
jgi:shikimate dehydrogenase